MTAYKRGRATMAVNFKGAHFPREIILTCVRWYVTYLLSTRHVEELMQERGGSVDHAVRWQEWLVICDNEPQAISPQLTGDRPCAIRPCANGATCRLTACSAPGGGIYATR